MGVDLGLWKYRKDLEPSYRGKKSVPLRSVTFYTWDFGGQVCVCVCVHGVLLMLLFSQVLYNTLNACIYSCRRSIMLPISASCLIARCILLYLMFVMERMGLIT